MRRCCDSIYQGMSTLPATCVVSQTMGCWEMTVKLLYQQLQLLYAHYTNGVMPFQAIQCN